VKYILGNFKFTPFLVKFTPCRISWPWPRALELEHQAHPGPDWGGQGVNLTKKVWIKKFPIFFMIFHKANKLSSNISQRRTLNVIPYFQDRVSSGRVACYIQYKSIACFFFPWLPIRPNKMRLVLLTHQRDTSCCSQYNSSSSCYACFGSVTDSKPA
jgi:hypothetical protein